LNTSTDQQEWVLIARILRPRGNKGEVLAELFTDFPARLSSLSIIYLRSGAGALRPLALHKFWVDRNHPESGIFHFADCASIDDAEKLRGYDVLLPMAERVELPAGKYFVSDLIGCTVYETPLAAKKLASPPCELESAPRVVGTVRDVFFPGEGVAGTSLLQVETPRGELLIPLAEDICRSIDVAARRIDVTLPEGLADLNAAAK
jgi:16S rRNA processing protein RimM